MNYTDIINAFFECCGGIFVALNAYDIWRRKSVAGQTYVANGFFSAWGLWNLFWYPWLGQFWSTIGACGIVLANIVMMFLLLKYRTKIDG